MNISAISKETTQATVVVDYVKYMYTTAGLHIESSIHLQQLDLPMSDCRPYCIFFCRFYLQVTTITPRWHNQGQNIISH